nr:hypothetical protein [Streptococcus pneumoniae]
MWCVCLSRFTPWSPSSACRRSPCTSQDTASTTEGPAAGGMHAQGEECSSPGASAGGGGGDRASVPGSCWGAAGEDADVPGCPR